jgi:predicted RNA-binding Zn-ribbon protein involved in translation (DUF1610 family)
MSEDYECPQCGDLLWKCEDQHGVTYQCRNLDCLGFFDAEEIELTGEPK